MEMYGTQFISMVINILAVEVTDGNGCDGKTIHCYTIFSAILYYIRLSALKGLTLTFSIMKYMSFTAPFAIRAASTLVCLHTGSVMSTPLFSTTCVVWLLKKIEFIYEAGLIFNINVILGPTSCFISNASFGCHTCWTLFVRIKTTVSQRFLNFWRKGKEG